MKKIYAFLFATLFVLGTTEAQDAKVRSLSIYDLTPASLNKSYTDSQGNIIKISTSGPEFNNDATLVYSATVDNPLQCIGGTPENTPVGAKYSSLIMVGHATAKTTEAPQILIEVAGDNKVLEVEVLAYATPGGANQGVQAELICAFSGGNNPNNDEDFMINMMDHEEPLLTFNQTSCATENKRLLPADTKFIKLISIDFFGYTGVMNYACKPQIHAINIYAKDTGTSIGEETSKALNIQLYGRNLQLNEVADIVIYDITGKIVAKYSNIDNAYLDNLASGVYVVSANCNGEKTTQKVVIK